GKNVGRPCDAGERLRAVARGSSSCDVIEPRPRNSAIATRTMTDWIYSHPNWLIGTLVVILIVALSCAGLLVFQRLVPLRLRRAHNDVIGFCIAVVGVVYAVLLAFIAVTTWEAYRRGDTAVASEANYVGDVFRNTAGLPDDLAVKLRGHLTNYIDAVITQ